MPELFDPDMDVARGRGAMEPNPVPIVGDAGGVNGTCADGDPVMFMMPRLLGPDDMELFGICIGDGDADSGGVCGPCCEPGEKRENRPPPPPCIFLSIVVNVLV